MKLYELKVMVDKLVKAGKRDLDVMILDKDDNLIDIDYIQISSSISNEIIYIKESVEQGEYT